MADRRVTQILTEAEYTAATNFRRVTQVLAAVEYSNPTNFRRTTQILLQVEYYKPYAPAGRGQGPAAQVM